MILDPHRLRLWLQKPDLPPDLVETIEWLIDQEEEYRREFAIWQAEDAQYQKEAEEGKTQIAKLKAELFDAKQAPVPVPVTRPDESEMRTITAKFDGFCKKCGGQTPQGSKIRWSKAIGAMHMEGECR